MSLAHIHPMIIHFPIVLMIQAAAIDLVLCVRGETLSAAATLALVSRWSLAAAAVAAIGAVAFGYLALDIAVARGFSDSLIERHESLGVTTAGVLVALAGLRFAAPRLGFSLEGGRARVVAVLSVAGVALVITTAYFGGDLVYGHGVNVVPIKP